MPGAAKGILGAHGSLGGGESVSVSAILHLPLCMLALSRLGLSGLNWRLFSGSAAHTAALAACLSVVSLAEKQACVWCRDAYGEQRLSCTMKNKERLIWWRKVRDDYMFLPLSTQREF